MAKKLTLTDLKSEVSKYNIKQRIDLSEDLYVDIYPNFSPSKISELIKNFLDYQDLLKKEELDIKNTSDWFLFNIIETFVDLSIPKDIKKKVQFYLVLRDSEHFYKIIDSFPEESFERLNQSLEKANKGISELLKVTSEKE